MKTIQQIESEIRATFEKDLTQYLSYVSRYFDVYSDMSEDYDYVFDFEEFQS